MCKTRTYINYTTLPKHYLSLHHILKQPGRNVTAGWRFGKTTRYLAVISQSLKISFVLRTKLIFHVVVISRINHSAMFWSSESPFQPISPTPSTKLRETNMTWTKILSLCWNPRFSKYLSLIRSWSQALFFHVTCLRLPFSPFHPGPQVSHLVQQWWNTPCHSCSKRNYI